MNESILSIIIPIYNVEKYLRRCIDSILEQEFKVFELILVDDDSPDNCGRICDEYADKDMRIKVIHKKNGGVSSARNSGLAIATGKYIAFVDGDDFVEKDIYTSTLFKIINEDSDLCLYGYRNIKRSEINEYIPLDGKTYSDYNEIINGIIIPMLFGTKNDFSVNPKRFLSFSLCCGIFRADIIKNNNIVFDETIGKAEDLLFYSRYLIECKKIVCIERALYNYVYNEKSTMHSYKKPSDYGFDRTIHIYSSLEKNLKSGKVPEYLYQSKLVERFVGIIIDTAKSLCDFRNDNNLYEIYKIIRARCSDSRLTTYLENKNNQQLRPLIKITSYLTRHKMVVCIIIMAKLLNIRERKNLLTSG